MQITFLSIDLCNLYSKNEMKSPVIDCVNLANITVYMYILYSTVDDDGVDDYYILT